jgi:hypothetical protein
MIETRQQSERPAEVARWIYQNWKTQGDVLSKWGQTHGSAEKWYR